MCGRIRLETDWSEIVRIFTLDPNDIPDFLPRFNVAPTQPVPVIVGPEGKRRARWMSWGFVPSWERGAKPKQRPINARAEGVEANGLFKFAYRERRCLVPVTGFYEWATLPDGKQPYLFARPDRAVFPLAGLWQRWRPEGGAPVDTFCVLTTTSNALAARLHDRMPVILPDRAAAALWTDPDADPARLAGLLVPVANDYLEMVPVSRAMNAPANESAEAAAPLPG